jgi:hypothetical protein
MLYGEGSMGCLKKHYYPEWFKLEQAERKKKRKKRRNSTQIATADTSQSFTSHVL